MECCPSFQLVSGKDRPRLVNTRRQQRVLYFYFLDPDLGLIYIRLTTWFPFTVQVYVNGHSWLAQQMLKQRLGFNLQDNAFTALDDPQAAQELADSFVHLNWTKILTGLVRQVNPLMNERWFRSLSYYWVDRPGRICHRPDLHQPRGVGWSVSAAVGPRRGQLLGQRHPEFLGTAVPSPVRRGGADGLPERSLARGADQTPGEEQLAEDVRQVRLGAADRDDDQRSAGVPGAAIADPSGAPGDGVVPDEQGVINLYRYREVALAANRRYLDALAVVDDPAPAYRQVEELTEPVVVSGRSHAGFRPALGEIFAEEFPDDTPLRRALDRFDQDVNRYIEKAKVPVAA